MKRRILGRTGIGVSEIGCGTYRSFDQSGKDGQANVLRLVHANFDEEINFIDTAPMYGMAETTLGKALNHESVAPLRDSIIVASKVLESNLGDAKRSVRNSEELIGRIDLMQIHNMAGWQDVLPWLNEQKKRGRFSAIGVTHYAPRAFMEMEEAMKTGMVDTVQIPYNAAQHEAEARIIPLAEDLGIGIIVMTPMTPLMSEDILGQMNRLIVPGMQTLYGVCDAGSLALKYVLSKNDRFIPIPATSKPRRVASNAAVSNETPLPEELIKKIEALF